MLLIPDVDRKLLGREMAMPWVSMENKNHNICYLFKVKLINAFKIFDFTHKLNNSYRT